MDFGSSTLCRFGRRRPLGSMFALEFETRQGPATLIASVTKQIRHFGNPLKAFEIIRDLGLEGGRFSVAQWRPHEREFDRPDKAQWERS